MSCPFFGRIIYRRRFHQFLRLSVCLWWGKKSRNDRHQCPFLLSFFFFIGKFQRRSPANLVLMELRLGRNERRKSFNFPNAHLTLQTRVRFVLPQRGWRAASFPSRWHGRLTMCCTIEIPPQQKKRIRKRERDCAEKLGELYKLGDDRTARGRASYARYKNGRL